MDDAYDYAYPDIGKMRATLEEYGIKCADSPLAFVQRSYKIILDIENPKTHSRVRRNLVEILEDFISADEEWQRRLANAKLQQNEPNQYENENVDIDYDAMIAEHKAKNARWISEAIDNAHNHSDDSD